MPAVEDCRKEIDSIIEEDAKLENYDDSPHVFVDISMSATDRVSSILAWCQCLEVSPPNNCTSWARIWSHLQDCMQNLARGSKMKI